MGFLDSFIEQFELGDELLDEFLWLAAAEEEIEVWEPGQLNGIRNAWPAQ